MKQESSDASAAFQAFNEIAIIAQLSGAAFERVLPEGLSLAGFGVLNHFVRLARDEERPTQLARNFQVTKGAMTNTLQRLEAAGFITLSPDPEDGRGKIARITRAGRAAREQAIARIAPVLTDLLNAFPAAELKRVLPVLTKLRQTLDAARD
ncbi:MAG: MarR family transcriptional regulator [Hyphomonadaceae bacterium]|jgi:DNA-binding MarR family transcriptional regulator|nr:MarR family transcriptional regulator [Hyphomonadaceae bacterium]